jgi:hypothetical protein
MQNKPARGRADQNAHPHSLPAQRPSRSVKPLLVVLGLSLLVNAAAWVGVSGPASRQVVVSLVLGVGVLVMARITHSRVPGIGWGAGCLVAILAVLGGIDELGAMAEGARTLQVLVRVGLVAVGLGYLLASALALWFWVSRRPPPPSALTPIAWR